MMKNFQTKMLFYPLDKFPLQLIMRWFCAVLSAYISNMKN